MAGLVRQLRRVRRLLAVPWLVTLIVSVAVARPLAAQEVNCDPGDVEVRTLRFAGNRAFADAVLGDAVVTTPSARTRRVLRVVGERRCIDRGIDLPRDLLRLVLFYRRRGFPDVTVDTLVQTTPRGVDVTFRIVEGTPVLVDSLAVLGLDSLPAERRGLVRALPVTVGRTFDRAAIDATRDTLERRLRNVGFPAAIVLRSDSVDLDNRRALVQFEVIPGPRARIGQVRVNVTPRAGSSRQQIPDRAVRAVLGVRTGDLYRYRDLTAGQRTLYGTDAYDRVDVRTDTAGVGADSIVDLDITLTEGFRRELRQGLGYGTLDCFRASAEYVDRYFAGGGRVVRRLEGQARLSKIGIGAPLNGARGLCTPDARNDRFGDKLNYYAAATVRQPVLFRRRAAPALTLFSERRSEYNAYLSTTPVGIATTITLQRRAPVTFGYELRARKVEAEPALFCAVFNLCDATTRTLAEQTRALGVISAAIVRDRSDNPLNPSRGGVARADVRHASKFTLSDLELRFTKVQGEASWYVPLGRGHVFAARIGAGTIFGPRLSLRGSVNSFIPPEERLFAGGATTVRGFRQNELGPLLYVAGAVDTVDAGDGTRFLRFRDTTRYSRVVPAGGDTRVLANIEARLRSPVLPDLLQFTLFADAGALWNRSDALDLLKARLFRVTPGVGVRIFTPVGPLRIDVGYNPYALSSGPVYYNAPVTGAGGTAPLYCVTPSNTLRVRTVNGVDVQDDGECPSDFTPSRGKTVFNRLNFSFSISQAF